MYDTPAAEACLESRFGGLFAQEQRRLIGGEGGHVFTFPARARQRAELHRAQAIAIGRRAAKYTLQAGMSQWPAIEATMVGATRPS